MKFLEKNIRRSLLICLFTKKGFLTDAFLRVLAVFNNIFFPEHPSERKWLYFVSKMNSKGLFMTLSSISDGTLCKDI